MDIDVVELHSRLLNMAKSFHKFCQENGLNYYILGGTCLGARRHKGFIPWDDDMDIGMPRKDYEKLIELQTSLPYYLELRYYENTPNSPMHFIKLIDNRSTLIEPRYNDYVEGLYIDIFPLDSAKNGYKNWFERLRWCRIWYLQGLIIYHRMTEEPTSLLKKVVKSYARKLNFDLLHNKLEKAMTRNRDENSAYIANFLGAWQIKEIVPREVMGTPKLYRFEDIQLYGPEQIDRYLKHLYGDYMALPKEEDRVFKHAYIMLDFNLPYREFLEKYKMNF